MHKHAVLFVVLTGFFICAVSTLLASQDTIAPQPPAGQVVAYHLDLSINELADGKKVNSRHYSMNIAGSISSTNERLNIGTRVPVPSEDGKVEYLDLGTAIVVQVNPAFREFPATINLNVEIGSIADPDTEKAKGTHPLLRQIHLSGSSPLIPDKQMIMASADDPDSKHEFQLTLLATKLN